MSDRAPELTLAVCTHNPRVPVLARTLEGLARQRIDTGRIELILVDNASRPALDATALGLERFPFPARICPEPQLGLTAARWRAFDESRAPVIVFVDDDNVLEPDYAARVIAFLADHPRAGAVGGRIVAEPEAPPPSWLTGDFLFHLAIRDLGDRPIRFLDERTPFGAGMAVRRAAMEAARVARPVFSDRKGTHPSSFGDSEICYRMRIGGWELWYEPSLALRHLLAAGRLEVGYHLRLHEAMGADWPRLQFFWSPGTPWRRLSYLRRALQLCFPERPLRPVADPDAAVHHALRSAFRRGERRALLRLALGPAVWRGIPSLRPGV